MSRKEAEFILCNIDNNIKYIINYVTVQEFKVQRSKVIDLTKISTFSP